MTLGTRISFHLKCWFTLIGVPCLEQSIKKNSEAASQLRRVEYCDYLAMSVRVRLGRDTRVSGICCLFSMQPHFGQLSKLRLRDVKFICTRSWTRSRSWQVIKSRQCTLCDWVGWPGFWAWRNCISGPAGTLWTLVPSAMTTVVTSMLDGGREHQIYCHIVMQGYWVLRGLSWWPVGQDGPFECP